MKKTHSPVTERAIIQYAAAHPEIANGRGFHKARVRSSKWRAEQSIPALLRAFDPAVLANEIQRHLGAGASESPKTRTAETPAGWYVGTLFEIANSKTGPTNARLHALKRIRGLMAACLAALHEPIREQAGIPAGPDGLPQRKRYFSDFVNQGGSA